MYFNNSTFIVSLNHFLLFFSDFCETKEEEEALWREIQAARRIKLQRKIDEYVDSFTTHGLTKGIKGTLLTINFGVK